MILGLPKYYLCLCSLRIASMAGAIVMCKCLNDLAPGYLLNKLCTRSTISSSRTAAGERAFNYRCVINMKQPEKGLETKSRHQTDPSLHSGCYEGTKQECRNVGSMNCNFSVTLIKSLNQSSIKSCQTPKVLRNVE